jgi:hypothetical protein
MTLATALLVAAAVVLVPHPTQAQSGLCPDVPHDPDPVELDCASATERWAVVDPTTGAVTNIVGWTGTNRWRPPAGQVAMDLPEGASVGPGWWYVDGEFVRDSFERNLTARADILSVHLRWSTGGLGMETGDVRFTVTVQPTGQQHTTHGSSLTLDPLEAGVTHSFTVTAQLPDGSTRKGPTVNATPEEDPDPDCTDHSVARECRAATNWAHIVMATGLVENVSVCTWDVCGDPGSAFRQNHEDRGIRLLDLDAMDLEQRPGPGWWYVDGEFIRDSFERNVTANARIHGVELRWSTGGLGTDTDGVTFTIDIAPTGRRSTTSSSRLVIDALEAGVEHTFTVTATRDDGSTVQGPVVTATPKADPDPDCTDRSVARECRAATDWAVVDPATKLVENVIVCTPWQCGADGDWAGRMPTDTPWPNFLLIELEGSGGIGWQYVDGRFIDVRPAEEEEASAASETIEDEAREEDTSVTSPEADDAKASDGRTPSTSTGVDDLSATDGQDAKPGTRSSTGTASGSGAGADADATGGEEDPLTEAAPEQDTTFLRRIAGTIAAFFSGLFRR